MPDPNFESVSSSEVAALFDKSQYYTRWMLWHAHHKRDRSLIAADPNDIRIRLGRKMESVILDLTEEEYRLEIGRNGGNEYVRRGPIGATIDGEIFDLSRGRTLVEAKNVDWLVWKLNWTPELAPAHIELQMQTAMHATRADAGIIAVLVGGNDPRWYERAPNPDLIGPIEERAQQFLDDVAAGREPDPLGSALELPALAQIYPESDPTEVVEVFDDEELALSLRQYKRAHTEYKIEQKTADQLKAVILARAGTAGILRTNGYTAYIKKSSVDDSICHPHDTPKVIRKGSVRTTIDIAETARREPEMGEPPQMGI